MKKLFFYIFLAMVAGCSSNNAPGPEDTPEEQLDSPVCSRDRDPSSDCAHSVTPQLY